MKRALIFTYLFQLFLSLNWQINLSFAGNLRNDNPPHVQIFELRPAEKTKLEIGETEHVIDKPPNSNIIVGEDIQPGSKLVLECDAKYPVQWVYNGDGMPEYSTNTTSTKSPGALQNTRPGSLFIASISLGFARPIGSQDSGKYTCRSLQNPDLSVYYFLYVTDQRLFTNPGGEEIYYKRTDPFVRVPCSVSNPKATVSLQKSVNGLVQCPLNQSITYDTAKGFELKISNYFDPRGTYVCTAGYNNSFEVVRYTLIPDVSTPEQIQQPIQQQNRYCQKNDDCPSSQACIQDRNGYTCTSPCSHVCGRNSQCDTINHVPRCYCLPGYYGDPYKACLASVPDRIEHNPCLPNPCGRDTLCEKIGTTARCSCQPGFQGDPYVRCYQKNPCEPSPCGQNSECHHRNGYTSCTCQSGYYGQPPYCRAECDIDNHCPSDRACVYGRCRNPCDGACLQFSHTQCRVIRRQAVCARIQTRCPAGYYGRDCLSIYTKIDTDATVPEKGIEETTTSSKPSSPCLPFPCGEKAECSIKTVKNTALNTTNEVALCSCPPNLTGNADIECYPIEEQLASARGRNDTDVSEEVQSSENTNTVNNSTLFTCRPECGKNAICEQKNICTCGQHFKGNPYTKCTPVFCKNPIDCDSPNATCISGKCTQEIILKDSESKGCGLNAIAIVSEGKSACTCPEGYTGIASIECHQIKLNETHVSGINGTVSSSSDICSQNNPCGKNAHCISSISMSEKVPVCECIKPFEGNPLIGCELNCTSNKDCPNHQLCHNESHRCIDPCEEEHQPFFTQCGRDARCKVADHVPLCYCPDEFPHGSPHIHCKEEGWMPNHRTYNSSCQNAKSLKCGPNTSCKRFHDSKDYCVCIPAHFGDPKSEEGCTLGLQCRRDTQCRIDEECAHGKCLNVCRNKQSLCGNFAGCKAENHKASCICHIGTIQNPKGECEPAKGALAERLLFFRSFEDV